MIKICIVVLNFNGKEVIDACLESLENQTTPVDIVVVDNHSLDGSVTLIENKYPKVKLIQESRNHGFAGGVNIGIKYAIANKYSYIGLINNDAAADKYWAGSLLGCLTKNKDVGFVTSKILSADGSFIDSTGDFYTTWGLPYPRGRGEKDLSKYDKDLEIFGASGGASLYRAKVFNDIGLFDEDFFAYYEDVDFSFRAQLAGWKVMFQPKAIAYHKIGATSGKIKGFTTYQTMKNLPMLMWKNAPARLIWKILPRFILAYTGIFFSAVKRGHAIYAAKGLVVSLFLMPLKLAQRVQIQHNRTVSALYIENILVHDLPPNAHKLRKLRGILWRLRSKHE